jgi:hypothetical protein
MNPHTRLTCLVIAVSLAPLAACGTSHGTPAQDACGASAPSGPLYENTCGGNLCLTDYQPSQGF